MSGALSVAKTRFLYNVEPMRSLLALSVLAVTLAGCSSGSSPSPVGPSTTTAPPPAAAQTLSGRLTATVDSAVLVGATITAGTSTTTTDASGAFTLPAPTFPMTLTLQGPGLVTRGVTLVSRPAGVVAVDAFRLDGQFDLTFYRQFVRGQLETGSAQPLTRRGGAPNIYLRTVDEAGAAMPGAQLDSTETAIRSVASTWAGGQFGIASVTRGSGAAPAGDWITVRWHATATNYCGITDIGGNVIDLAYKTPNCGCGNVALQPRTVKHELGHAFGYWHTDSASDVMYGVGIIGCDADPSPRERYHAALAYRRPAGNRDPDIDP